ncbi:MAG: YjgP/YjgQ family permease [Gemmatimonadetes bacterium]|nr:YjgP/YjgQ family permease [Gemmatimonadota bacterium]
MKIGGLLDRYVAREWIKVFLIAILGFPLVVSSIDLADKLDDYLARGLSTKAIGLAYLYGFPEKLFMVLPAAVLFASVFTIGAMGRHSELTAAKATGRSFFRIILPTIVAGLAAVFLGLGLAEIAPPATSRQAELLGEKQMRVVNSRYNFVFRADQGWVYAIRSLDQSERVMRDVVLEREGTGADYPTLAIQAFWGKYIDSAGTWTLGQGRFRVIPSPQTNLTFAFDSMYHRALVETPAELLAEPKTPEEMRYAELGRYIDALDRSGGDARKLKVDRALKLAVPATCLIIALFAAPLAITGPRSSAAYGVALSLAVTIFFLIMVQLSRAIGTGGLLPPTLAAWTPNILFGAVGLWMLKRAPT